MTERAGQIERARDNRMEKAEGGGQRGFWVELVKGKNYRENMSKINCVFFF